MQKFTVQKNQKLSDFLLEAYENELSYSKFCMLLRKKDIKINSQRVNKDCLVFVGDIIECYFDGQKKPLEIVYIDENIVVCNKPQGITSEDYYNKVKSEYPTAYFTHRLDRNTFGLIIFALNEKSYVELFEGFKQRTFEKYYTCLVSGAFEKQSGELNDYMVKNSEQSLVKVYKQKVANSLAICTRYEQVAKGDISSVLKIELVTGRTHQIRAHLAYYGHFIIGDGKYGKESINRLFKQNKQLLIASSLTLKFNGKNHLYYLNGKTFFVDDKVVFEKLK
ncbi:MAG: RluA family pseudouridine synthase [Clostridia bacterium]|nr:RluA family pseudouridine synthase [Clostridia bacterium]